MQLFRVEGEFWVQTPVSMGESETGAESDIPQESGIDPVLLSRVRHTTLGLDRAVRFVHKKTQRHSNSSRVVYVFLPGVTGDCWAFQGLAIVSDGVLYDREEVSYLCVPDRELRRVSCRLCPHRCTIWVCRLMRKSRLT
jgi:hypothetical protein